MNSVWISAILAALAVAAPAFGQNEPAPTDSSVVADSSAVVDSSTVAPEKPLEAPAAPAAPAATVTTPTEPPVSIDPIRPGRTDPEIRRDRDQAAADEREGNLRLVDAKEMLFRAKSAVSIQENEIKILETKQKVAKQAKNATEQKELETRIKAARRKQTVLQRLQDVEESRVSAAESSIQYARAVVQLCSVESDLLGKRNDLVAWLRTGDNATTGDRTRFDRQLWDLETRVLDASRTRSAKLEDWAEKERSTSAKKLDVYGAYSDMMKK